jgi:tRNA uridine 5-carbamoylmethylation protein Kti12|tara:strand:+ start:40 stop:420 length:381 start_codon:yes stop_codon:yes gene_type:complete
MDPRQYKGTISENKAINKFLEEGYLVFKNTCEQGPIDIIVVNPKTGNAFYLDIKTSKGNTIIKGKNVGGSGNKLKPKQKELGVRLCLVEGNEIRIVEKRETISQRQRKEKRFLNKARKGVNILEEC